MIKIIYLNGEAIVKISSKKRNVLNVIERKKQKYINKGYSLKLKKSR